MTGFISKFSHFLWGPFSLVAFLGVGIYLTFRLRFFQFTKVHIWFKSTVLSLFKKEVGKSGDINSISQRQALFSSLAACVGTGNIVGVATAIAHGGAGAVFWMWVSAFFGMITAYCENFLSVKYRFRNKKGEWFGGASAYLKNGVGSDLLAIIFSVFCTFSSFGIGNMTQANSISVSLNKSFGISPVLCGITVAIIISIVIFGGLKRIAAFTEKTVPIMSIIFLLASFVVIFKFSENIIPVFKSIITEAFSFRSVSGGAMGFGVMKAMRYGISRGVFSNEAGLGSTGIIHAASDVKSPHIQGMWGIAEVFIDTILMCTVTAFTILCPMVWNKNSDLDGVELNIEAFASVFGNYAPYILTVCLVLFSFATIVGWSYYGEISSRFAFGEKSKIPFKLIYIIFSFIGCVAKLETVWNISDIFNFMMAVPNLYSLIVLSNEISISKKGRTQTW